MSTFKNEAAPTPATERPPSTSIIPLLLRESIRYLIPRVRTKGLFRVPGNAADMKSIMRRFAEPSSGSSLFSFSFQTSKSTDLSDIQHVHSVAGLIPLYLRARPPLCTDVLYPCFIAAVEVDGADEQARCLRKVVRTLPTSNFFILAVLIEFLRVVSLNAEFNQMTSYNLAVAFAPVLLRCPPGSGDDMSAVTAAQQSVVAIEVLIDRVNDIFTLTDEAEDRESLDELGTSSKRLAPVQIDPHLEFGDAPLPPSMVLDALDIRSSSFTEPSKSVRVSGQTRPNSLSALHPVSRFDASRPPSSAAPEPPSFAALTANDTATPQSPTSTAPTTTTTTTTTTTQPFPPQGESTATLSAAHVSSTSTGRTPAPLKMDAFRPFGDPLSRFKQTMARQSMLMAKVPLLTDFDYSAPTPLELVSEPPAPPTPPTSPPTSPSIPTTTPITTTPPRSPPRTTTTAPTVAPVKLASPPSPKLRPGPASAQDLRPLPTPPSSCDAIGGPGGTALRMASAGQESVASDEFKHLRRNSFLHRMLDNNDASVVDRIQQNRTLRMQRNGQGRLVAPSARPPLPTQPLPRPPHSGLRTEPKVGSPLASKALPDTTVRTEAITHPPLSPPLADGNQGHTFF